MTDKKPIIQFGGCTDGPYVPLAFGPNGETRVLDQIPESTGDRYTAEVISADVYDIGGEPFMSGWQPIETAPKDGAWVLVNDPKGVPNNHGRYGWEDEGPRLHVLMAYWAEKEWIACFGEVDVDGCPSGGYDHWVAGLIVKPTHWMPLPEPPAT